MSRIADKYKNDVWAFLYNPTHMAGLQVFFQALLNKNSLIYLFQTSRIEFMNACEKHSVTNISATPTFYRLLAPFDFQLNTIRKCTLGGEKSEMTLIKKLKAVFPNSNIYNIYASTEAGSIFISNNGDVFKVLGTLKDKVRFDNNEIIIHKSLLGKFYKEEWFSTGDIIEFTNQDKTEFRIASRKSDTINIGGNRINLLEIESEIYKIKGVKSTLVYTVNNSVLGEIITAEIVSSIKYSKKEFKEELKKKLQLYKIPTMIKFVEELQVTRTGKLKRS
jgi:acyl-coenzyme A synthetase/AMP-(fatty) acid ligase